MSRPQSGPETRQRIQRSFLYLKYKRTESRFSFGPFSKEREHGGTPLRWARCHAAAAPCSGPAAGPARHTAYEWQARWARREGGREQGWPRAAELRGLGEGAEPSKGQSESMAGTVREQSPVRAHGGHGEGAEPSKGQSESMAGTVREQSPAGGHGGPAGALGFTASLLGAAAARERGRQR